MLRVLGLVLIIFGFATALGFFVWWIDRLYPSRASRIEKVIEECDRRREKDYKRDMKFVLWGVCNQIELQKALEESDRKKKHATKS